MEERCDNERTYRCISELLPELMEKARAQVDKKKSISRYKKEEVIKMISIDSGNYSTFYNLNLVSDIVFRIDHKNKLSFIESIEFNNGRSERSLKCEHKDAKRSFQEFLVDDRKVFSFVDEDPWQSTYRK